MITLNLQQLMTCGMPLLTGRNGIPAKKPIRKISYGVYQGSYVTTEILSKVSSLYHHINHGFAVILRNLFPNENAFKNYKPVAKSCIKFKRLDVYKNLIGTIPKESATTHPEITDGDHINDHTPDNR